METIIFDVFIQYGSERKSCLYVNFNTNHERSGFFFLLTWLFMLFAHETEDFTFVWTIFIKIREKLIHSTSDSSAFHGQGHLSLNETFSIFPVP